MPITPDTKNWTWVLERPCGECGFDGSAIDATDVARLLRQNTEGWPAVLERPEVRVRPDDATWSPLEYAAHVRDVHRIYLYRLGLMLDQNDPLFPNWDQDETAEKDGYNAQDPMIVSVELATAAEALASAFDGVSGDQWSRPGRRSDGVAFTVDTFARYFLHDPVHHLHDVGGSAAER